MTARQKLFYGAVLVMMGAAWGFTQPMTKLAVSEGYKHFGLIFWQLVIGVILTAALCLLRGVGLPMSGRHIRLYAAIACLGTLFPNTLSYQAAVHLPAGIISILFGIMPLITFPIAMALGLDRFEARRLLGLFAGLAGVALIVLPGEDISGAIPVLWVGAMLIVCIFYAGEGNYVAKWGTEGLDPIQVLFGASLIGLIAAGPLVWFSGQWIDPRLPWGIPDLALIASSCAHVLAYATYVWLVARAGPVFTAQVSYLVTVFGLIWARLILSESYSTAVWGALALMLLGMYLVQPRRAAVLA